MLSDSDPLPLSERKEAKVKDEKTMAADLRGRTVTPPGVNRNPWKTNVCRNWSYATGVTQLELRNWSYERHSVVGHYFPRNNPSYRYSSLPDI